VLSTENCCKASLMPINEADIKDNTYHYGALQSLRKEFWKARG
jgi:hypothetical protein